MFEIMENKVIAKIYWDKPYSYVPGTLCPLWQLAAVYSYMSYDIQMSTPPLNQVNSLQLQACQIVQL